MLTNNVSSVLPKHEDLHIHVGVVVSQQREDESQHLVNVPAQCACTFAIHDPDTSTTPAELLLGQETEEYL